MFVVILWKPPRAMISPSSWSLQWNSDLTFIALHEVLSGSPYKDFSATKLFLVAFCNTVKTILQILYSCILLDSTSRTMWPILPSPVSLGWNLDPSLNCICMQFDLLIPLNIELVFLFFRDGLREFSFHKFWCYLGSVSSWRYLFHF